MKIKGCVNGQKLSLSKCFVVEGTLNYLTAFFEFRSDDWAGLDKYAHFEQGKEKYRCLLIDDRLDESAHLNFSAGDWDVWIHGECCENGEVTQRITTNTAKLRIRETGIIDGDPFPDVPPSEVERLHAEIAALKQIIENSTGADPEAITEAVKKYLEENPIKGITDHAELSGREKENQHNIGAIAGLQTTLDGKQPKGNYLTEEKDPTVPEWAKKPEKPTYTAEEVGALPDTTEIPSLKGYATEQFVRDEIANIELPEVGGGSGVTDHADLTGRNKADQHPINAITGLEKRLLRPGVNLLHNADWAYSLVNQREHSGEVSDAYCIDRWIGNGSVTPVKGQYVTLADGTTMTQRMEIIPGALIGKECTFSIDVDGTVESVNIAFPATVYSAVSTVILSSCTVELGFLAGQYKLCDVDCSSVPYIKITATADINVKRLFLELGNMSHMARTQINNYNENLAACQRFSRPIIRNGLCFAGYITNGGKYVQFGMTITPMRVDSPSIETSTNLNFTIRGSDGYVTQNNSDCTVMLYIKNATIGYVAFTVAFTTALEKNNVGVGIQAGGGIYLSADL